LKAWLVRLVDGDTYIVKADDLVSSTEAGFVFRNRPTEAETIAVFAAEEVQFVIAAGIDPNVIMADNEDFESAAAEKVTPPKHVARAKAKAAAPSVSKHEHAEEVEGGYR